MRSGNLFAFGLLFVLASAALANSDGDTAASLEVSFENHVRPILKAHCLECHGEGEETEGGLDLRLRRLILAGGDSGPGIVAGQPEESPVIERTEALEMPPGDTKLTVEELTTLRRWIVSGAKTLRDEPESIPDGVYMPEEERDFWSFAPIVATAVPEVEHQDRVRTPIDAFLLKRLEDAKLTFSSDADRRTLIRRATFDLTGLPPSPEDMQQFVDDEDPAAFENLIDRLLDSSEYGERWGRHWLDVVGYADSEGYTLEDTVREHAWHYRDYVIQAFNNDLPFDQFIRQQIAGDEMIGFPKKNLSPDETSKLIATGFLRMVPDGTASGSVEQPVARNQVVADAIQIIGSSLLGLTLHCAQCHNHRYDPIPQTEYFQVRAIFEPAYDWKNWRVPKARLVSLYTDEDRNAAAVVEAEAKKVDADYKQRSAELIAETLEDQLVQHVPEELRDALREAYQTLAANRTDQHKAYLKKYPKILKISRGSLYLYDRDVRGKIAALKKELASKTKQKADPEELAKLQARLDRTKERAPQLKAISERAKAVRAKKPREDLVRALTEIPDKIPATHFFSRGDYRNPGEAVEPAVLSIPASTHSVEIPSNNEELATTGRRLTYADYLTSGKHPLVARVLVNRFWMHHFGQGIVTTPGDFGLLGERPSHPELLDWLAADFMQNGWSLKHFHRQIMTSTAWRQALRTIPQNDIDPDNRLLSGMSIRRLEAETLRDSVLAISGNLNPKQFGPPIPVMPDRVGQIVIGVENETAGRPGAKIDMKGEEFRRSVYVQVRRSRPLATLDTFDAPQMTPNCETRPSSTVAPQSLMMMNSDFVLAQSNVFAQRTITDAGDSVASQIRRAWELAFSQSPTEEEMAQAEAFIGQQVKHLKASPETKKLMEADKTKTPELLALASFCQTLFSSNRFLYVD